MRTRTLPTIALLFFAACAGSQSVRDTGPKQVIKPDPKSVTIDKTAVRAQLAKRRATHLSRLLAYANAGEFPINTQSDKPLNVFIDADGKICAAANLMELDGYGDLVRQTAKHDNFIVLATVTSGPLYDWMLSSGLTQEEIANIQEPYMPFEPGVGAPVEPARPQITWQDQERMRMQAVLRGVHQVLSANSEKSLDIVMERLQARPDLMAALASSFSKDVSA